MRVRHVLGSEGNRLRELRLASLLADPDAFASTYARQAEDPPERWRERAAASEAGTSQRTFVLTDEEDRWQGLALVRHHPDHSGSAAINAMWIAPEARGRRGAGLLCDACAAWARAQELHELKLDVAEANEAAVRAYKAAGFAVCGKTTWSADGRTLHELVMTRPA